MRKKVVVIKIGSNVVTENGGVSLEVLRLIAKQVVHARAKGYDAIIVSSGAVSCGKKFVTHVDNIVLHQVAAAIGQPILMQHWAEVFAEFTIIVGQFLETHKAFENPGVISLLQTALDCGIVPVINENDAVSTEEMKKFFGHGDNDMLAAIVAAKLNAAALILLTNVDGLYASLEDMRAGKVISCIPEINEEILKLAGLLNSDRPTGMGPKLLAARHTTEHGIHVWIANGFKEVVPQILAGGQVGTHCLPRRK